MQEFLMKWRGILKPLHRAGLAAVHARIATDTFDQSFINPKSKAGKTPLMEAYHSVMDRQREIKKTGYRDCEVDFDFEVSIMPHGRNIYGIIYTERGSWRDLFMDQPEISDFSYWDNSDRPSEITARQWRHRYKVWDALLLRGPDAIPAMRGLSAQCTTESFYVEADDIVAAIKPHEVRVRNLARSAVMDADMKRRMARLSEAEVKSRVFETFFDVEKWLKSPDGNAALQAKIKELEIILPKKLTKDMLLEKRPTPDEPDSPTPS
ncbi:hypothetical protein [Rhizobium sp. MHM7A]|uniref:hypothetical protein n=1 Tax=Rhizobium sp. MHM7A TaxID=2583233 RepID=UPI0011063FA7|nr:hypothetical protein [Rhizobium sp. MHM7A]TLX15956.1 hypothetical protein FFR93_01170 [Rhizobium sp. MHM7A]